MSIIDYPLHGLSCWICSWRQWFATVCVCTGLLLDLLKLSPTESGWDKLSVKLSSLASTSVAAWAYGVVQVVESVAIYVR